MSKSDAAQGALDDLLEMVVEGAEFDSALFEVASIYEFKSSVLSVWVEKQFGSVASFHGEAERRRKIASDQDLKFAGLKELIDQSPQGRLHFNFLPLPGTWMGYVHENWKNPLERREAIEFGKRIARLRRLALGRDLEGQNAPN